MIYIYSHTAKWPKKSRKNLYVLMEFDDDLQYKTFLEELGKNGEITMMDKEGKKIDGPYT